MLVLSRLLIAAAAVLLGGAVFCTLAAAPAEDADNNAKTWLFVGTYTGGKSKGIYRCEFDPATGKLSEPKLAAEMVSPSFMAIHPKHRFLYAVNEIGNFEGKPAGSITAFALDPKNGELKQLNRKSSQGAGPCHVIVDRAGKHVLAANYTGGSLIVLGIEDDGRLGEKTSFVQLTGKGFDRVRQEKPHAHSINLDAANRHAFLADLGLDKVFIYDFDAETGALSRHTPLAVDVPAKSGPRHFAFHPNGKYAYVINEMASTVMAMKYDAEKGDLKAIQIVSTLPSGQGKENSTAEVQVHPSGKFLYGSNRGHNSIAIFTIDEKTGKLKAAGHQGKDIKTPRNFAIDPSGKFLLVANQDGDSILVFSIDAKTGALRPTGEQVEVGKPVCLKFAPKTP